MHEAGGRIFAQIWHVGRISHVSLQPNGGAPVAPSAIRANTRTFIESGFADVSEPRALRRTRSPAIVADFAHAAANAKRAGFDGVEIHGANGYLDRPVPARRRQQAHGRLRRLDREPRPLRARSRRRARQGLARLARRHPHRAGQPGQRHRRFQSGGDVRPSRRQAVASGASATSMSSRARPRATATSRRSTGPRCAAPFAGAYIANNGYTREMAIEALAAGRADLVAFGRPFIANPDLVERLRRGAAARALDRATLYSAAARTATQIIRRSARRKPHQQRSVMAALDPAIQASGEVARPSRSSTASSGWIAGNGSRHGRARPGHPGSLATLKAIALIARRREMDGRVSPAMTETVGGVASRPSRPRRRSSLQPPAFPRRPTSRCRARRSGRSSSR